MLPTTAMDAEANTTLAGASVSEDKARALARSHLGRIFSGRFGGGNAATVPMSSLRGPSPARVGSSPEIDLHPTPPPPQEFSEGYTARPTYAEESKGLRDTLFPAGAPPPSRPETAVAVADARLEKELQAQRKVEEEASVKYDELSAYLSSSLVHEQTNESAAADYLDDDAVESVPEAAQLEIVQRSLSEEKAKLGPLRAARKLAEKRRKETHAVREKQTGFSDDWLERHMYGPTPESATAALDELDLELQKEDLLLQQDRLRLQSGSIEVEEPHGEGWLDSGRSRDHRDRRDAGNVDDVEAELAREARLLEADLKRRQSASD